MCNYDTLWGHSWTWPSDWTELTKEWDILCFILIMSEWPVLFEFHSLSATLRSFNYLLLQEINPKYSLEKLMLKLKLQYFGHLMWRADSLEKTLILGNIEGRWRREQQEMRWLDGTTDLMDMSLNKFQEMMKHREPWCVAVHVVIESDRTQQLSNNNSFLDHRNELDLFIIPENQNSLPPSCTWDS